MKLKSMKMTKAEREEKYAVASKPMEIDAPVYPWGLEVRLDDDALEKLGIDLPKVGKTLMLVARVDVTSVTDNKHATDGSTHRTRSVTLQITDMSLESGSAASAAEKLYDGSHAEK